jgi:hypothetical protein
LKHHKRQTSRSNAKNAHKGRAQRNSKSKQMKKKKTPERT